MDLFTMIEAVIYMSADVRASAEVSADEMSASRKATEAIAIEHGVPPERAAEVAEETERVLTEFADALHAAARAAEKVKALAEEHAEEMENHAQSI
jgi:hypothetical protein